MPTGSFILIKSLSQKGNAMRKRQKMSKSGSKRLFKKTASRTHKKNVPKAMPMRGGIRL